MTKTILIVEDDQSIRDMLKMLLEHHDYHVLEAKDYPDAIKLSQSAPFHLVLLDWMLPGGNGIQFIKHLKKHAITERIPVIMLTAKQQESDQILGFDSGADDYMTKPFSNKALLARIKALLRRSYPVGCDILEFGDLKLDTQSHSVIAEDHEIELGPTEYKLLLFFMTKPERVFTRDQLIDHVWGHDAYIDDRTIDVHIGRLRKQLELSAHDKFIQTVRGAGYRFSAKIQK
ncbi:two-component system phosphate regulon response regulator PhoB [Orbus hercynius]|uniref:Phosphate regulon transcriptional regulatory protein PhoB n=1 Tax=Orbus hercynius TaxID=593135 RepID=A0A495RIR8_9GAMM|nr:phosphate regulon transcriptional regulator PhoB [Orbus hercynius]RKS87387.1 two-component system phosphate regulon response regulator PhoB [Orbus hercynius]